MQSVVNSKDGYRSVLSDDESLKLFLQAMKDFDSSFCKTMNDGSDFTLSLEVRGEGGKLLHVRVKDDSFSRPKNSLKNYKGDSVH